MRRLFLHKPALLLPRWQVPSTDDPGGSHVDGPLECRLCDMRFSREDNKQAHLHGSRHQAAVLLQQLRASGSISANQAGLEVSEFPDDVSLEVRGLSPVLEGGQVVT